MPHRSCLRSRASSALCLASSLGIVPLAHPAGSVCGDDEPDAHPTTGCQTTLSTSFAKPFVAVLPICPALLVRHGAPGTSDDVFTRAPVVAESQDSKSRSW